MYQSDMFGDELAIALVHSPRSPARRRFLRDLAWRREMRETRFHAYADVVAARYHRRFHAPHPAVNGHWRPNRQGPWVPTSTWRRGTRYERFSS